MLWQDRELAVVVYLASRNVSHSICSDILQKHEGMTRTTQSIRSKLGEIRKREGLWDKATGWNIPAVDGWLITLQCTDSFEDLLELVPEVSRYLFANNSYADDVHYQENRAYLQANIFCPPVINSTIIGNTQVGLGIYGMNL